MRPSLPPNEYRMTAEWLTPAMRQGAEAQLIGNPLIELASPLLRLALHLRQEFEPLSEAELYRLVSDEILAMEPQLVHQGFGRQTISDFRYLLCCVLDEAVMSQPWGSCGVWSSHSLLTRFHQQSWGGEQFFVRLQQFMSHPTEHQELLQFAHLCLHLGYEGRYRIQPQGETDLRQLQQQLHRLLYPDALATHSATLHLTPQPQPTTRREAPPLPLALYGLGAFLLLSLTFLCLYQSLAQQSAQIMRLLLLPLH